MSSQRTTFHVRAEFDDGTTWDVVADQRSIAEFEVQPFGLPYFMYETRPFTFLRFMAWHAGKLQKLHTYPTWEAFTAACVFVENLNKTGDKAGGEAGADDAEDPGRSVASAES